MVGRPSKYSDLAKHELVRRWLRSLARGSALTAEVAQRRFGKACELLGVTPRELLEKARADPVAVSDMLEDLVSKLESERKSPGYIEGFLKTLRSWLRYHGIILGRRIKIRHARATPTIEDEQVPTQAELSRIFRASPPRVRVAEALMALSDLRPMSIGNHDGTDGLMLKDLPELRIEGNTVSFERIPAMIVVRATLSKAGHKYFTFLPSEGCTYVKEYLEERLRSGEELGPESPLIGHERPTSRRKFMITRKITHLIRQCMRRVGVYKRPYVLRAYAETALIIAESKGAISHPYLQFFAGHKGDIEARYSTNKGRLPPDMIEDMREAYKRCERFLCTTAKEEVSALVKEAQKEALKSIAKNVFGIDLLEVKIAKEKELGRGLELDEEIKLFENELRRFRERQQDPQRIVEEEELESFIAEGWEFVSALPSGRVLIRRAQP